MNRLCCRGSGEEKARRKRRREAWETCGTRSTISRGTHITSLKFLQWSIGISGLALKKEKTFSEYRLLLESILGYILCCYIELRDLNVNFSCTTCFVSEQLNTVKNIKLSVIVKLCETFPQSKYHFLSYHQAKLVLHRRGTKE